MKTAVIVGSGNRGAMYATYALREPEKLKIVGVVEPNDIRREAARKKYDIPEENCYSDFNEFVKREKFADAVINGTMDEVHVSTSIPALRLGYDMLLEKPFAVNEKEMKELLDVVKETGRKVYICHVLRYTPFYSAIKRHIANGDLGKIISMEHNEHVSYHHMCVSFVRGKWRSEKVCSAPMLLAKCCHDMDLMMWMMSDYEPLSVASFGSEMIFSPKNKPEGAGERCMGDCPMKDECRFAADVNYISPKRWRAYVHAPIEDLGEITDEMLAESLKTDNPYGKCAWDFERDGNVDHQSVIVNFSEGATGVFNLVGGAARGERNIHIVGTKGEIKGTFEDNKYILRTIAPKNGLGGYEERVIDVDISGDYGAHGGGDMRLVADFVAALEGKEKTISATDINDSEKSHKVVFRAEEARKSGCILEI